MESRAGPSRRKFLGTAAGATVGAAAMPALGAGAEARPASPQSNLADSALLRAAYLSVGNIALDGFDDMLPRAFEADMLHENRALQAEAARDAAAWLSTFRADTSSLGALHGVLVPKPEPHAFRRCAVFDATDAIRYLAAVMIAAETMEPLRIPVQDRRVFSHRFRPEGARLFDPAMSKEAWAAELEARLSDDKDTFLVIADVQDFYGSIDAERLCSTLSAWEVDSRVVGALALVLQRWRQSSGRGVPVGSNASRFLSEIALIKVDRALADAEVDFTRFADDYRLFAPDEATAQSWLATLVQALDAEGFALNPGKVDTQVLRRADLALAAGQAEGEGFPVLPVQQYVPKLPHPYRPTTPVKPAPKPAPPPRHVPPRLQAPIRRPGGGGGSGGMGSPGQGSGGRSYRRIKADTEWRPRLDPAEAALLLQELRQAPDFGLVAIRDVLDSAHAHGAEDMIEAVFDLLDRYPHAVPYAADFMIEEVENLTPRLRDRLADRLARRLNDGGSKHDYDRLFVLRTLAHPAYARPRAIEAHARTAGSRSATVVRAMIEGLGDPTLGDIKRCAFDSLADPSVARAALRVLGPGAVGCELLRAHANRDDAFTRAL